MFLSQQKLKALSEADLRKEVLIPLFQAMGFQDVFEYHGSDEFGKDIVMWQKDVLEGRTNFAVVAKAKNITGAVSKGHISEICIQVRQCFGQPFLDPIDSSQRAVDRVIVVTSGSITRPARKAIQVELGVLASQTVIIDGGILWRRIREYMPNAVLWDNLNKARKLINEQSGDLELTLQISPESTAILASPKSDMAEPISGTLGVEFLDTIEGLAKKAEFLNHFRTGQPVLITKDTADKIEVTLPEFLRNLAPEGEITHLYLGPSRATEPQLRRLIVEGREGTRCVFEYIEFSVQSGTEQVTLSNERQPIPFKVNLTLTEGHIKFDFSFEVTEHNVVQGLRALTLMKALSEGSTVRILYWESNLEEFSFEIEPGQYAPPTPEDILCFSALAFIQNRLSIPFVTKPIGDHQFTWIKITASALQSGRAVIPGASLNLRDHPELSAPERWEELSGQPFSLPVNVADYKVTILEKEISLGPARILCRGIVTEENVDGNRTFFLRATEDSPFLAEFPNWLNTEPAPEEPLKEEPSGEITPREG